MIDLYIWWKVADDLSEKHALNAGQKEQLEWKLIIALRNGSIRPLDKYGQLIWPLRTISKGAWDVWVGVSDVNKHFFNVDPKFVWKPRKKLGRPVSFSSLEVHRASGKLKRDAIEAAAQLKSNAGRPPHRSQVANRLANKFSDYSAYEASYIEKKLRVGWWRN